MSYETITYEISECILTITLNRPEKLNAFTAVMARDLIDAFERADADEMIARATDACRCFLAEGLAPAMNRYNSRPSPLPGPEPAH